MMSPLEEAAERLTESSGPMLLVRRERAPPETE